MNHDDINALLADVTPTPRSLAQQAVLDFATMLSPVPDGPFVQFRTDPVRYVREVLKMEPWSMQVEALELLVRPQDDEWQGKLAIGAGVGTGKTCLGGMIVNWYFDCWGPCIVATTAPSQQSVKDLLWKEVRIQRSRADAKWGIGEQDFIGPQATEMRRAPDWWARGYVAAKGEALDVETIIESPVGRVRFGDLKVGDYVFGANGEPIRILGTYRQGRRKSYRVSFRNGTSIVTDANHLWSITNWRWKSPRVMTTIQMIESGVLHGKVNPRPKFQIPAHGPVQYAHVSLDIPAYTMGVWLGDGACFNGTITSADPETIDFLRQDGWEVNVRQVQYEGKEHIKILCLYGLHTKLRECGLLHGTAETKRVPIRYLHNDISTRLAVLQGLMDTDGWIQADGACYFGSCSKGLVEDVIWLVRSLGGNATLHDKVRVKEMYVEDGKPVYAKPQYRASMNLHGHAPFRLPRKANRLKSRANHGIMITSIEECGEAEMACIAVDAADGLFLANDFIVTHNTFKGRHVENMCFLFDESIGLNELYFRTGKLMFKPKTKMLWLAFFNPTDTTSTMYREIIRPDSTWRVIELSCLDHPNIQAALEDKPLPIPSGVSLEQVEEAMLDDCEPVAAHDKTEEDFEWPPGSNDWWRPGAAFCGEFLGRWPSGDDSALWSDALWQAVSKKLDWSQVRIDVEEIPRIGADIARQGDDKTALHVSWGDYSVFHESKGKIDPAKTTGRIIELADQWAEKANESRRHSDAPPISGKNVPIMIDDDAAGGVIASFLRERGYRVFQIGAATKAIKQNRYRNKRSELWFVTRERAKMGKLKLGLLHPKILMELRRQAMAPLWALNSAGQREVEEKDKTKKRLGRSPDDMDSMNLSYFVIDWRAPEVMQISNPTFQERMEDTQHSRQPTWRGRERRGLFRRS